MSGTALAVVAPTTITDSRGIVHSADPEVRKEEARARIVAAKTGAIVRTTEQAKIAAFDEAQVKAGKQMTGEQATRHQQQVQTFHDRNAFALALGKHVVNGRVSSDIMNACAPLLHGYKLPAGITVNAQSVYIMLEVARKAGFQQSHVDAFIKAEIELGLNP